MASTSQSKKPCLADLCPERLKRLIVPGHPKIAEMTLHDRAEPFTLYRYWFMHHALDLFPYFFEFCPESFGYRLATNCETIVFSATAHMRKP